MAHFLLVFPCVEKDVLCPWPPLTAKKNMDFVPVTSIDSEVEQDWHYNLLPWENNFDLKESFFFSVFIHIQQHITFFSLWTWTSALLHKRRHTCMSLFKRQTIDSFSIAGTVVTLVWTAFVHLKSLAPENHRTYFLISPLSSVVELHPSSASLCFCLYAFLSIYEYVYLSILCLVLDLLCSPSLRCTLLSVHLSITILFTTQFN